MSNTGTFTINNGAAVNINSANAITIASSGGSVATLSNTNTSFTSQQDLTLQAVSGHIKMIGLPTSDPNIPGALYNAGGFLMISP